MIAILVKVGDIWIRFVDSYRMMSASLDELSSNLPREQLIQSAKLVSPENIHLVTKKGTYPYDYITSDAVFEETSLPPRSAFANKLNDTEVSDENYRHAETVWNTMKFKNFGEYHDFYLTLDTCLLSDVINSFRDICYKHYQLDINHFFTAPSLTWQAMLKHTAIDIELMTDIDMVLMIEESIRGGLVQSSRRWAQANNEFLAHPADYDPNKEKAWLLYLDAVNLYGYALKQPLPVGNFQWVENPDSLNWSNLPSDAPTGYILECDVEVPDSIHDKLNDLPPLPERAKPPGSKVEKLIATLYKKEHYIAHYTLIKQAQKLGCRVTKVHRALKFSQSPWMEKYIEFNSKLRSEATNKFSKDFFKLLNNATFGKSLQNNRRHMDVRVVTTKEALEKYARQPRFVDRTIIREGDKDGIVLVYLRKDVILLDKPLFVGSVTLDLSKLKMYWFWYDVLSTLFQPPKYTITLIYTDTDSLVAWIKGPDNVYEVLKIIADEHLDLSNLPHDHPLRSDKNKQVAGKFKDETAGKVLYEHVGLKSKMYCQRYSSLSTPPNKDTSEVKKAKGIKNSFVEKVMRFEHYKDALFNKTQYTADFNLIRSKSFQLTSQHVSKRSLSFHDDKRYILDDGYSTLAHGHFRIKQLSDSEHRRSSSSQNKGIID
ncbi:uncharacterized protein LOC128999086 [Macrosteles quadrilineatus]|uniref:uncharacterized protein LOC128999086 n=1 Tax=Macrosteles quadrilineatus TaxID=74068 RepID=UPI0023E1F713|nr:uncharacterized protein LOC128999086 [Macrosteles quadrilineatus]